MKYFLIVVIVLSSITGIAIADDAPFGLSWGMTEKEVRDKGIKLEIINVNNHLKHVKTEDLLQNISIAKYYSLSFSKKFNLQKVIMFSKIITDDLLGRKGKAEYENIKLPLSKKYGAPSSEYEKIGRKLFDDPDEFYQCLAYSGCGRWISFFDTDYGPAISLEIKGLSRGTGYLQLGYEGPNWAEAVRENRKDNAKSDAGAL